MGGHAALVGLAQPIQLIGHIRYQAVDDGVDLGRLVYRFHQDIVTGIVQLSGPAPAEGRVGGDLQHKVAYGLSGGHLHYPILELIIYVLLSLVLKAVGAQAEESHGVLGIEEHLGIAVQYLLPVRQRPLIYYIVLRAAYAALALLDGRLLLGGIGAHRQQAQHKAQCQQEAESLFHFVLHSAACIVSTGSSISQSGGERYDSRAAYASFRAGVIPGALRPLSSFYPGLWDRPPLPRR